MIQKRHPFIFLLYSITFSFKSRFHDHIAMFKLFFVQILALSVSHIKSFSSMLPLFFIFFYINRTYKQYCILFIIQYSSSATVDLLIASAHQRPGLIWRHSLSLSNFFDSENIGLRRSLSLSKKFDNDNECPNLILEHIFQTVPMQNFLAQQQDVRKTTYDQE